MRSALAAFVIAAVVGALLVPVVRRLAIHLGAFDASTDRRVHAARIPRLGGIAVVVAFFAPLGFLFSYETGVARIFFEDPFRITGLGAGGLLVAVLGAADDLRGIRAWHKLAIQTVAAVLAFACGYRIDAVFLPFIGQLEMGVFALPITVLWIVGIINALNLIDGLDGLAAGIAFFACVTNFVVAAINGDPLVMLLAAALAGSILGFLIYNFNPASIFMGDSGSMFLGYVLATMSLVGASIKSSTTVAILVPIVALGVPIMDTLFAMMRRFLERRPIFAPDKGHIHHRLLDLGITHRRAVLILYAVSIVFTAAGIAVALGRSWEVGGALLIMAVVVVGIVRSVGYFEYVQLRRRQRMHLRSRSTERLRRAVPELLAALCASSLDELPSCLEAFARDSELLGIGINHNERLKMEWLHDEDDMVRGSRDEVEANYPVPSLGPSAQATFVLLSDDGDLSPQADILLQLAVDALDARLLQVLSVETPNHAPKRSSAEATRDVGVEPEPNAHPSAQASNA